MPAAPSPCRFHDEPNASLSPAGAGPYGRRVSDAAPPGPLLLLSPHLDDAALSCGALLDRTEAVTVLDVFTHRPDPEQFTDWDRQCGFTGSHAAMAARWAEEQAAFDASPHVLEAVDLLDGQYLAGPRSDDDRRRITRRVDAWLAANADAYRPVVVVPVGAGTPLGLKAPLRSRLRARKAGTYAFSNSPDHLFVRDTVLEHLRERTDVALWCYEELPYLYALGGAGVVPAIERWTGRSAVVHDLPVDRAMKAKRIAAYESQLAKLFREPGVAEIERSLPPTERYWELRAG